jgi:hypothetical protein
MAKIKIDSKLCDRAKKASEGAGYSSLDEFVTSLIEKELSLMETAAGEAAVDDQLRGLGYIE